MLKTKRELPPSLSEAKAKIEAWRTKLVKSLHERIDVAIYLLVARVYYLGGMRFILAGLQPNSILENFIRDELFGLQFALSALNDPLPNGPFLPDIVCGILNTHDAQRAKDVLDYMSEYSRIRDAFLTYTWGGYEFEKPQDNVIRFIDPPTWIGYRDNANRVIGQEIKAEQVLSLRTNSIIVPLKSKFLQYINIPTSLPLDGLTASQFLDAWFSLTTYVLSHCVNNQSPVIERAAIADIVQRKTKLTSSEANAFISLVTFDPIDSPSLSLFHCPLVSLTTSSLAIVPTGFIFSNPNTCIQRLAVHRGLGFDHFAKENEKHFLIRFEEHFRAKDVTIHTNRHYTGDNDSGDIDLIIFESKTNRLLIAQLKGFIQPDTTEEVIRANQKLEKGLKQITRVQQWLNTLDKKALSSRLDLPKLSHYPCIEFAVIGNGFVGSDYLHIPEDISVVDADYLLLPKFKEKPIFDAVHECQKRLSEEIAKANTYQQFHSIELAGITFELSSYIAAK